MKYMTNLYRLYIRFKWFIKNFKSNSVYRGKLIFDSKFQYCNAIRKWPDRQPLGQKPRSIQRIIKSNPPGQKAYEFLIHGQITKVIFLINLKLDLRYYLFKMINNFSISFRVNYPIPPFQSPNNQHLLKGFWRHINNYYFKKIQQSQLDRIHYLQFLLQPLNQCDVRFQGHIEFWYTIQRIFSQQYLKRYQKSHIHNLDCKNWLQNLYLVWQSVQLKNKNKNKVSSELKKIRQSFTSLQNWSKSDQQKRQSKLLQQQQMLSHLLPQAQPSICQVQEQILQLQSQLSIINQSNTQLLQTLKNRVHYQLSQNELTIIKYNLQEKSQPQDQLVQEQQKCFRIKKKLQKIENTQIIKTYLNYIITNLEKKQVAQSISKILRLDKTKHNQHKFVIQFQTGMNLNDVYITEQQMIELNQLRQYNLFKFYNTSLKTPYSFICQNFYGFRQIYDKRLVPCALKEKNILQEIKKSKIDFNNTKAQKQFRKFDICHHCKLMYPQQYLISCQYSSQKNGLPITASSYYDPYVSQITKLQQPKQSNRFIGSKRSCFLDYTKKNDQFICQRKFCKYCMKQNYQDGLDKNGLCPFCQGICFCTRCARNQMLVRLKSMYLLLGGDLHKLQQDSFLDRVHNWEVDNQNSSPRINSRTKVKPPKKIIGGTPARMNQKMRNIRYQLEDLRILCDLVKRRQKQKQKLVQIRCQSFAQKINLISKGFDSTSVNESSLNSFVEQKQGKHQQKRKIFDIIEKKKQSRII